MHTALQVPCFLARGVRGGFLLLAFWLQGCAHSPDEPAYPVDWHKAVAAADLECPPPVGEFANQGSSGDSKFAAPPLASILFDDKLAGFPVESIRISHNPDDSSLVLRGVLAGVALKQHKILKRRGNDCELSWSGKTKTGTVNATMRTQAIVYTGGVLMPLNEKYKFNLRLLEDGALLVQLEVTGTMLGALIIPMSFSDNYWLRYDRYVSTAASEPAEVNDQ